MNPVIVIAAVWQLSQKTALAEHCHKKVKVRSVSNSNCFVVGLLVFFDNAKAVALCIYS